MMFLIRDMQVLEFWRVWKQRKGFMKFDFNVKCCIQVFFFFDFNLVHEFDFNV